VKTQSLALPTKTHAVSGPQGSRLIVPVDAQLERSAVALIVSRDPPWRIAEAIDSLQYFKSDANISLLKILLNDSSFNTPTRANPTMGSKYGHFRFASRPTICSEMERCRRSSSIDGGGSAF
jgi:hypothetical protein